MFKKITAFLFFFSFFLMYSQQNREFGYVMEYYDYQRNMLNEAFRKEASAISSQERFEEVSRDYEEFMVKLDSIRNVAMLSALITVKNREDLENIQKINQEEPNPLSLKTDETPAQYPGGIDNLRKQLAEIFYYDAADKELEKLSVQIYFIVEEDGSISTVRADGENFVFNRQAEIAVYMLPEKFSPAQQNGRNIRYGFRIPLTMKFE
ncbi:MAG: hypothetical protein QM564_05295 [Bergeyella sp.]